MRSTHSRSRWTRLVGALCRRFPMNSHATVARTLAAAFVAGDLDVEGLVERGSDVLGKRWRWLRPLAQRVAARFGDRTRPRQTDVAEFIRGYPGFARACRKHELRVANALSPPSMMCPVQVAKAWPVPSIRTAGQLAEWLGVTVNELDWFADLRGLEFKRNEGRLRHYHYRPLAKGLGHVRLIEAPKAASQRDPASRPYGYPEPYSSPYGSTRVSSPRFDQKLRRAACRESGCLEDRSTGLLSFHSRGANSSDFPNRWLPGERSRSACRSLHELNASRCLGQLL